MAVAGDADLEDIFQQQRQQPGARFAAEDRAVETGGQQVGDSADVVEVDMADDQGAQVGDGKLDLKRRLPLIRPLKQSAVDQDPLPVCQPQLVARAGDPIVATVMDNLIVHGYPPPLVDCLNKCNQLDTPMILLRSFQY